MRFRSDLFRPPRFVGSAATDRRATWLELFFDLVFVVAVGQAAGFLSEAYDRSGLLRFTLIFIAIWWAWIGQTFYASRFDQDDATHRLITMGQMFAIAALAVNTQQAFGASSNGFVLSYFAIRAVLVIEYLRAGWHIPMARPLTTRYAFGFSVAALLWLVSLPFQPSDRALIWTVAMAVDIVTPFTAGIWNAKIAPHVHHLPERFGLFTIIVLGESVLSVVLGLDKGKMHPMAMFIGFLGWIVAFSIWWCYFDGVKAAEPRSLRTPAEVRSFRIWLYIHFMLMFGIVVTAIGIKHAIMLKPGQPLPAEEVWILATGSFLAMVALTVIFETTPYSVPRPQVREVSQAHWILTLVSTALVVPVGVYGPAAAAVGVVAGGWAGHVVLACREVLPTFRKNASVEHVEAGGLHPHPETKPLT